MFAQRQVKLAYKHLMQGFADKSLQSGYAFSTLICSNNYFIVSIIRFAFMARVTRLKRPQWQSRQPVRVDCGTFALGIDFHAESRCFALSISKKSLSRLTDLFSGEQKQIATCVRYTAA